MKTKIILHFAVTYLVADLIYHLLPGTIGQDPYWMEILPSLIAFTGACLAGIGKELWDRYHDKEAIDAGDLTVDFTAAIIWLVMPRITEILPWAT